VICKLGQPQGLILPFYLFIFIFLENLRFRLVRGIGIPLRKEIVIIGNEEEWNEIIILIP
jgi:hypothetical protein